LVRLKVDIIVAEGTQGVAAAKKAAATNPIVTAAGRAGPVGLGFIQGLARPGGHVTRWSYNVGPAIAGKELELLTQAVPQIHRVASRPNPATPVHPLLIRELKVAARSLEVQLQLLEARGPAEFDGAFAAMTKERVGALLVVPDSMFTFHRTRLAALAARSRLP